jgi:hypothetical protein
MMTIAKTDEITSTLFHTDKNQTLKRLEVAVCLINVFEGQLMDKLVH